MQERGKFWRPRFRACPWSPIGQPRVQADPFFCQRTRLSGVGARPAPFPGLRVCRTSEVLFFGIIWRGRGFYVMAVDDENPPMVLPTPAPPDEFGWST
jgi:hypothetical protein